MTEPSNIPTGPFLDVQGLIEHSQPPARVGWLWYGLGSFLLIVMVSYWAERQSPAMATAVQTLSWMAMLGLFVGLNILWYLTARRVRAEQMQLEAVEELVTLRRWPQAGLVLENMLSQPTRTPTGRVQALLYLSSVLARYHRFDDAVTIHTHLLDTINLDPATTHAIRLGRAMALLREDRLLDADRAIAELRRSLRAAQSAAERRAEAEADEDADVNDDDIVPVMSVPESGGLALIEIYRDVKTGHPDEAIQIFNAKLPAMRSQLGNRVADAYALIAKAYDLLGKEAEAREFYEKATLLAPVVELNRRYPEVQSLADKYTVAQAPAEMQ
jgi:tetratricopeptide (TPR) repeat protein